MKRWGMAAVSIVVVLSGWLLAHGLGKRTKIDSAVPQHTVVPAEPQPTRMAASPRTSTIGAVSSSSPEKPPQPTADHWRRRAHDRRELLLNLKPERVAEIEAVAPRFHLSREVTETLSRWSDLTHDLIAASYEGVETEADYNKADARAAAIGAAHQKAEVRVLGGLDNWNRFYVLLGYAMTGKLDSVNDDGSWKGGPPHHPSEKAISAHDGYLARAPKPDTTPYDHYFE